MIEKIAQLASIKLKEEEKGKLEEDFNNIRNFIGVLKEVSIQNITPTIHPFIKNLSPGEDTLKKESLSENIINNAPEKEAEYFKIEKIL